MVTNIGTGVRCNRIYRLSFLPRTKRIRLCFVLFFHCPYHFFVVIADQKWLIVFILNCLYYLILYQIKYFGPPIPYNVQKKINKKTSEILSLSILILTSLLFNISTVQLSYTIRKVMKWSKFHYLSDDSIEKV